MTHSPFKWFDYPIRVQPHHTDYGGVVWHGSYVTWLESARVECLRAIGIDFKTFVDLGYDLPVVDLSIRYRQPLTLGDCAVVKARLAPMKGIRLPWIYEISMDDSVYLTAQVTLVTVDVQHRRVVRRLPPEVRSLVQKLSDYFEHT